MEKSILMLIYGQVTSQPVIYVRETEASTGFRITEQGDLRITGNVLQNTIEGSMTATCTLTIWQSEMYCKRNGDWKIGQVFVKNNNMWKTPTSVYKKLNNNWKRVY